MTLPCSLEGREAQVREGLALTSRKGRESSPPGNLRCQGHVNVKGFVSWLPAPVIHEASRGVGRGGRGGESDREVAAAHGE